MNEKQVKESFSAIFDFDPKGLYLNREQLASCWLSDDDVGKFKKEYTQIIINGVKTPLTGEKQIRNFLDVVVPQYLGNKVVLKKSQTFRWSGAKKKICKLKGFNDISVSPTKAPIVKQVILQSNQKDIVNKEHEILRHIIATKFPHVNCIINCQQSGPCNFSTSKKKEVS